MKTIFFLTVLVFTSIQAMASNSPISTVKCPSVEEVKNKIIKGDDQLVATKDGKRWVLSILLGKENTIPYVMNGAWVDAGVLKCFYTSLLVKVGKDIRVEHERKVYADVGNCTFADGTKKRRQCEHPDDCGVKCAKALPLPPK